MKYQLEHIIKFLSKIAVTDEVKANSDLFADIGIVGDDLDFILEDYATTFSVNMDNYLWYFHNEDEVSSINIGRLFFTPPYKKVKRIPITPLMLTNFANKGKWDVQYPKHELPSYRYDIIIHNAFVFLILLIGIIWFFKIT